MQIFLATIKEAECGFAGGGVRTRAFRDAAQRDAWAREMLESMLANERDESDSPLAPIGEGETLDSALERLQDHCAQYLNPDEQAPDVECFELELEGEPPAGGAVSRFMVLGLWEDDSQRWADSFEAPNADAAEAMAPSGIEVAGVVALEVLEDGREVFRGVVG